VRILPTNLPPARLEEEDWLEILRVLMMEETGMSGGGGSLGVPALVLSRGRRTGLQGQDPSLEKGHLGGLDLDPRETGNPNLDPDQKQGILGGLEVDPEPHVRGGILGPNAGLGLTAAGPGLDLSLGETGNLDPVAEGVKCL
jgi:hypothetical protein